MPVPVAASVPWPIFVISLDIATQRRADIEAQMTREGLSFTYIDALDGRNGLPPEYEHLVDREGTVALHGYPMGDGEFACAISHQMVYRRIIDEGLPGAIVLEDDAILTPQFVDFYRNGGYLSAEVIQLFCFAARIWRGPGRAIAPGVHLHRLAENAFMTVGYTMSRKAADFMIRKSVPLRARADWPTDMTQIGIMLTIPSIIQHPKPEGQISYIADTSSTHWVGDFDFSSKYPKGWRRLISASAWSRFFMKRFSREIRPGF